MSNCWLTDQKFKEHAQRRHGRPSEKPHRRAEARLSTVGMSQSPVPAGPERLPLPAVGTRGQISPPAARAAEPQPGRLHASLGMRPHVSLVRLADPRRPRPPCSVAESPPGHGDVPSLPLIFAIISIKNQLDDEDKTEFLSLESSQAAGGTD